MTVGNRIKAVRLSHNMSQEDVAKFLGTTKQAIYKYENDVVTNIPLDKIDKLAFLFDISPAYLMGWEETPSTPAGDPKLSEGEQKLLELFRQIPEEKQGAFVEMARIYAESLKEV